MPLQPSGDFSRLHSWVDDALQGLDIDASRMDEDSNDMAGGITAAYAAATDAQAAVTAQAASLATSGGAGLMGYARSQSYAAGTIGAAIKHLLPNLVTDYLADPTGAADSTAAMQSALDDGVMFNAPPGVYKVTAGLDWKHGSRMYGAGCWSEVATPYELTSTSVIQYAGPGGLNSYVVKVSDAPMGTNPSTPSTRDMQNCALNGVHIDGGDLAEFGLVEIRSWAGNDFDNISISNTRRCANWAVQDWTLGPRGRRIVYNRGAGAWLGNDIFSWGGSNTVDQCTLIDWYCSYNGCDATGTPYNTFTETGGSGVAPNTYGTTSTNAGATCGIGIYGNRSLTFDGLQCEHNDGPGLYMATTLSPVTLINSYMEDNARSSGATRAWSTWFNSSTSSFGIRFQGGYFGNPSGRTPAHRFTGSSTTRPEQSLIFAGTYPVGIVDADTGFLWRLEDSDRLVADGGTLVILNQGPTNFHASVGLSRSVLPNGNASFTTSGGAISATKFRGIVTSVTRSGTGAFVGNFAQSDSLKRYLIFPSAMPSGWNFELGTLSASSFTFTLKSGGVATDPTSFYAGFSVIWDND